MTTKNVQFSDIINKGLSRRKFLQTTTTAAFFAASPTIASATSQTKQKEPAINFSPVPTSVADTVVVPEGYQAEVLIS